MKIIRTLASEYCPNGVDCAKVHELDEPNLLVRGYIPTARAADAHRTRTVRIPAEVRRDAGTVLDAHIVDELPDGAVLIRGTGITTAERAGLRLPDHEDAVRVPHREEALA